MLKKFSCLQNVWWQKSFGLKKLFGSKNCVVAGGWIWVVCKVILVFRICLRIWKDKAKLNKIYLFKYWIKRTCCGGGGGEYTFDLYSRRKNFICDTRGYIIFNEGLIIYWPSLCCFRTPSPSHYRQNSLMAADIKSQVKRVLTVQHPQSRYDPSLSSLVSPSILWKTPLDPLTQLSL